MKILRFALFNVMFVIVMFAIGTVIGQEFTPQDGHVVFQSPPTVHVPFRAIFDRNREQLVRPLFEASSVCQVYFAEHENGRALWLQPRPDKGDDLVLYLLKEDGQLESMNDPGVEDTDWFCDRHNEVVLDMLNPPYGAFAVAWKRDVTGEHVRWLGARIWHRMYQRSSVYVQHFQHGLIVGSITFKQNPGYGSVAYVLFTKSGTWKASAMNEMVDARNYVTPETDCEKLRAQKRFPDCPK